MAFVILICFGAGGLLVYSGFQNEPVKDSFTKAVSGVQKSAPDFAPNPPKPQ